MKVEIEILECGGAVAKLSKNAASSWGTLTLRRFAKDGSIKVSRGPRLLVHFTPEQVRELVEFIAETGGYQDRAKVRFLNDSIDQALLNAGEDGL